MLFLILLALIIILISIFKCRKEISANRKYWSRVLMGLIFGAILFRYGQALFALVAIVAPFLFRHLGSISYVARIFHKNSQAKSVDKAMGKREAAEVLGVSIDASKEEISKKYKKLMKAVHPDMDGSEYMSSLINNAKDILLK